MKRQPEIESASSASKPARKAAQARKPAWAGLPVPCDAASETECKGCPDFAPECGHPAVDVNAPAPKSELDSDLDSMNSAMLDKFIGNKYSDYRAQELAQNDARWVIGRALLFRRNRADYGDWKAYVENSKYGFGSRTANNYIVVAERIGRGEPIMELDWTDDILIEARKRAGEAPEDSTRKGAHKKRTGKGKGKSKGGKGERAFDITDAPLRVGKLTSAVDGLTKDLQALKPKTKTDKGVAREALATLRKKVCGTLGLEGLVKALVSAIDKLAENVGK